MNRCDVIIVGAGPAGSTFARQLKKAGLSVKLFDKKAFPRVKPCAGWITPQVITSLELDVDEYRGANTFQPISGFKTGILGDRIIETNYDQPVSYGIRRVEFDDYLLRRSGVPCEQQTIKQVDRTDRGWIVNQKNECSLLVGAGGHFCPVARYLRGLSQQEPEETTSQSNAVVVYAQEVEFEISPSQRSLGRIEEDKPELYFCRDLMGYGWCFRKGKYLNIGLGRTEKANLSEHVNRFCEWLRAEQKIVDELPSKFLGHAYRLYAERQPELFSDNVLLIGDAAGLAYPQSGEGIRPAVESALIAADVAIESAGDFRCESLSEYEQRMVARFGKAKPIRPAQWLPMGWIQSLAAGLMATRWFAKHMVVESWFLNRNQSALVLERET